MKPNEYIYGIKDDDSLYRLGGSYIKTLPAAASVPTTVLIPKYHDSANYNHYHQHRSLYRLGGSYDSDLNAYVIKTKTLGSYVISSKALMDHTTSKPLDPNAVKAQNRPPQPCKGRFPPSAFYSLCLQAQPTPRHTP